MQLFSLLQCSWQDFHHLSICMKHLLQQDRWQVRCYLLWLAYGYQLSISCSVIAVFALIVSLCIQGIVSEWMDVLSIYICPLGAGLAGIMFFWVLGKKYVENQVNLGRTNKFTDKFYPVCKYIYCPVCILVLILGIVFGGIG